MVMPACAAGLASTFDVAQADQRVERKVKVLHMTMALTL